MEEDRESQADAAVERAPASSVSLHDVLLNKCAEEDKVLFFDRLFFVSKNGEGTSPEVLSDFYRDLIDESENSTGEEITGLCLVTAKFTVNLLEASWKATRHFLKALQKDCLGAAPKSKNVKIIAAVDDAPKRLLNTWSFIESDLKDSSGTGVETQENVNKLGADCYVNLLDLANGFKGNNKITSDDLYSRMSLVPTLDALLRMTNAPDLCSLDDFLRIFDNPVTIDFDEDRTFPPPAPLKY